MNDDRMDVFAMNDREAIFDYIEQDRPRAAVSVDDEIESQVGWLSSTPEMGRVGRLAGTQELAINRTPYIAVYQLSEDRVRILRVLHGAQQWPELPSLLHKAPRLCPAGRAALRAVLGFMADALNGNDEDD